MFIPYANCWELNPWKIWLQRQEEMLPIHLEYIINQASVPLVATQNALIYDFITATFKLFPRFLFPSRDSLLFVPALFLYFVWQALTSFFYYTIPLHFICISNFHTSKKYSFQDLKQTTFFILLSQSPNISNEQPLRYRSTLPFYFLLAHWQKFSWLMKNNLYE